MQKKYDIIKRQWTTTVKPEKGKLFEIASQNTDWVTIKSYNTLEEAQKELNDCYYSYFRLVMVHNGIYHYEITSHAIEVYTVDESDEYCDFIEMIPAKEEDW